MTDESDFDEEAFEQLNEAIRNEFPTCPFDISCIESLEELDKKFTDEKTIFIYDDRADGWYFEELEQEERNKLYNYTKVDASNKQYITIRDILNAMINDPHYHDQLVTSDDHLFLEFFEKSERSDIQYSCFWGS